MPQSPSANPAQKAIVNDLVGLSQKSAVSSGNQITLIDSQLTRFKDAQKLFQDRYDYWDKYIGAYHAERKSLNGIFILNPIVAQDYVDFMATKGRIYKSQILNPIRIQQFDQVTSGAPTGNEHENELNFIAKETQYRAALQTGFVSTAPLPVPVTGTYETVGAFAPGATTMTFQNTVQDQEAIPQPGQILIYNTASPTTGVIVEYLTVTENQPSLGNYTYTIHGLKYSQVFASIPSGSVVASSGPAFTNPERTTKIALNPLNQSRLAAYIEAYKYRVQSWSTNLTTQVNQIAAEIAAGEDAPDTAYGTSIQTTATALQTYLTTMDVSNTGLTAQATRNSLRTTQNPARRTWIDARLIQQTKAYDQRYHYADRLYNLGDGATPLIIQFQGQKSGLATQQAASNYRAAQLSGEVF